LQQAVQGWLQQAVQEAAEALQCLGTRHVSQWLSGLLFAGCCVGISVLWGASTSVESVFCMDVIRPCGCVSVLRVCYSLGCGYSVGNGGDGAWKSPAWMALNHTAPSLAHAAYGIDSLPVCHAVRGPWMLWVDAAHDTLAYRAMWTLGVVLCGSVLERALCMGGVVLDVRYLPLGTA